MKEQTKVRSVWVLVYVVYSGSVESARTPNYAMHFVPFGEQELS